MQSLSRVNSTGSHRIHCGRHPATKEAKHVGFRKVKYYVGPRGYGRERGCILKHDRVKDTPFNERTFFKAKALTQEEIESEASRLKVKIQL